MVYTQHLCAKCGSDLIRRNGHRQGHARYQCKVCRYQARFVPAALAKAVQDAQVAKLLGERNSQRSLARVTGVARMSIAKLVKKSADQQPPTAASAVEKSAEKALGSARAG